MRTSIMNLAAALTGKYSVTKLLLILLAAWASLQGCATMTEAEREQLAYNLNEARRPAAHYLRNGMGVLRSVRMNFAASFSSD